MKNESKKSFFFLNDFMKKMSGESDDNNSDPSVSMDLLSILELEKN